MSSALHRNETSGVLSRLILGLQNHRLEFRSVHHELCIVVFYAIPCTFSVSSADPLRRSTFAIGYPSLPRHSLSATRRVRHYSASNQHHCGCSPELFAHRNKTSSVISRTHR